MAVIVDTNVASGRQRTLRMHSLYQIASDTCAERGLKADYATARRNWSLIIDGSILRESLMQNRGQLNPDGANPVSAIVFLKWDRDELGKQGCTDAT